MGIIKTFEKSYLYHGCPFHPAFRLSHTASHLWSSRDYCLSVHHLWGLFVCLFVVEKGRRGWGGGGCRAYCHFYSTCLSLLWAIISQYCPPLVPTGLPRKGMSAAADDSPASAERSRLEATPAPPSNCKLILSGGEGYVDFRMGNESLHRAFHSFSSLASFTVVFPLSVLFGERSSRASRTGLLVVKAAVSLNKNTLMKPRQSSGAV